MNKMKKRSTFRYSKSIHFDEKNEKSYDFENIRDDSISEIGIS